VNFTGFSRADGSVGIRNKLLIVAVDECCEGIAQAIAKPFPEAVVLTNWYTCMLGGNEETLQQLIEVSLNPNVAAVLVLAMGCGSILPEQIASKVSFAGKPAATLVCQDLKGTRAAIEAGRQIMEKFHNLVKELVRKSFPLSRLVIGLKCGGSDTSSGLASNPSVGMAADLLVDLGGTAICGELFEVQGWEEILAQRAACPLAAAKIKSLIKAECTRWSVEGTDVETMSIGNSIGGLTTIEEKSLGALHKTGSKPILDVLTINKDGVQKPAQTGFYLSEATMLCGGAGINFAALGAHLILWTTGGAGFENPIVPVIRVSGNHDLFNEDMDIDARGILNGTAKLSEIADQILSKMVEVASGGPTRLEGLGSSTLTLYQKDQRLEKLLSLST
jgi:altronate dehydratase large subunit